MASFIIFFSCLILIVGTLMIDSDIGIIIMMVCCIPEFVGVILGIKSIVKKKHIGLSIAGTILNGIASVNLLVLVLYFFNIFEIILGIK